jgi:hypothetical protein
MNKHLRRLATPLVVEFRLCTFAYFKMELAIYQ